MKTGCLFATLSIVSVIILALLFGFVLDAALPKPNGANFEGVGRLTGFVIIIVVPWTFILGYRRQARREAQKPRPPENLRPIDYSRLGQTTQQPPTPNRDDRNA
jgi:hypothetical protein